MRPLTHYLGGLAVGIMFAPNPICLFAATLGGGVPDKLDILCSWGNRERWEKIHRTWSHNIGYWILPVLIWFAFWPFRLKAPWNGIIEVAQFFFYGICSHLVLDLLTPMGVGICPFASVKSRVSLKLVKTNSLADALLGPILVLAAGYWRYAHGFDMKKFFGSVFNMWVK